MVGWGGGGWVIDTGTTIFPSKGALFMRFAVVGGFLDWVVGWVGGWDGGGCGWVGGWGGDGCGCPFC